MSEYISRLKEAGIVPNFYISEEYFRLADLHEVRMDDLTSVRDGDWTIFPPIDSGGLLSMGDKIWSDFSNWSPSSELYDSEVLDLEYIYDPKRFLEMTGGDWAVFRKNSRKFPNRHAFLYYRKPYTVEIEDEEEDLYETITSWLEGMADKEVFDDVTMMKYLKYGENKKVLTVDGVIVGLNIWDENYYYVNFRYSFCGKENFLPEYMRLLFYTDPEIQAKGKLVNDGGICNNENLRRFKDKMLPVNVREVKSWIRK